MAEANAAISGTPDVFTDIASVRFSAAITFPITTFVPVFERPYAAPASTLAINQML